MFSSLVDPDPRTIIGHNIINHKPENAIKNGSSVHLPFYFHSAPDLTLLVHSGRNHLATSRTTWNAIGPGEACGHKFSGQTSIWF